MMKKYERVDNPFSNRMSFSSNHNIAIISHDLYRKDQVEEKEAQLRSTEIIHIRFKQCCNLNITLNWVPEVYCNLCKRTYLIVVST